MWKLLSSTAIVLSLASPALAQTSTDESSEELLQQQGDQPADMQESQPGTLPGVSDTDESAEADQMAPDAEGNEGTGDPGADAGHSSGTSGGTSGGTGGDAGGTGGGTSQ